MPAGRVLATQQARDAAKQLHALTGPVKEQVRRVLQHGGTLADPNHWDSSLAGKWRYDWGQDVNQLNQIVAKLDKLEHAAQQVVEDIFKADDAPPSAVAHASANDPGGDHVQDVGQVPPLNPPTEPGEVKKWWDGLSPAQQESLLLTHPDQLARLDGLPSAVRDRANRSVMADQKGRLQADKERLDQLGDTRTSEQSDQLDSINKSLAGIDAIEKRLNDHAKPPAFLLGFDSSGPGRAIVAVGDPDTAANVATYVPGTGANLGGVNSHLQRSDSMELAARIAGSPSTAVITWVGYDAPPELIDATQDRWADGARQDLDRFQDGLRASHMGAPAHNTIVGHSYGTTVIGHAARDGTLNADDVVFVGSPGVGVTRADQLHLDGVPSDQVGQHVHSTVAQYDPIKLVAGIHGPSPTALSFGGENFDSNPGEAGPWYTMGWNGAVHSQYWDDGNKSLVNTGRIIAGKPTY
ncbi:MAG: alpha/beta hydrolase [Pseudonocardiaceae bacterium]